jgi:hypothetical protein
MADNCFGESVGAFGIGVQASDGIVNNCSGYAVGGSGISAENVANSRGVSASSSGISATVATNCIGNSTSGTGLSSETATNCYGSTTSSGTQGLSTSGTASFCRGNRPGGVALQAGIAIGCTALNGTITSAQKPLGTP